MKHTKFTILVLSIALANFACTKKDAAAPQTSAPAGASAANTAGTTIEIGTIGETMAYDKTSIEVKAGSQVTVHLKNNATSPAMRHNWVLAKPGTGDAIGTAAISAGEAKDYIPESADILAHTTLTQPGGDASVTFTAPAAGEYPYLCTFPGHFAVMKGTLKSVP